jgi:uncharacterized membrane protein YfcA
VSTLLLVAGFFVLAGIVQALSGFGSALVSVPLLALVLGARDAVVLSVLVSLVLCAGVAMRERRHVDRVVAWRLLAWSVPALGLGLGVARLASERSISLLVGAVVVLAALLLAIGVRLPDTPLAQGAAGVASGALLTSTGLNGPPLVIALAARRSEPRTTRATLQFVFAVQDVLALAGFVALGLVSPVLLGYAVLGVVGMWGGWMVGGFGFRRLSRGGFDRVVLLVLVASGVSAVVSALR